MMPLSFLNRNLQLLINMPREIDRKRVSFKTAGESLTHQSEHDRAEINRIIKRGVSLPDPNQMQFGDFSDGSTFNDVQNAVAKAKSSFELLPSGLRDRFKNDPSRLIDFINDPENANEAAELGLIEPLIPSEDSEPEPKDKKRRDAKKPPSDASEPPSGGDSEDPPSTTPS